jgi:hypothetical protein
MYGNCRATTSAIAQSVAMRAHQDVRLLSSFFFSWNGDSTRQNSAHLISTIVYRAARFDKNLLREITHAIHVEPDIRDRQAAKQISRLVTGPFQNCQMTVDSPLLVMIDALDTCDRVEEPGTAQDIARFIQSLSATPLCIKILITSRFEQVTSSIIMSPKFPRCRTGQLASFDIEGHQSQKGFSAHWLSIEDKGTPSLDSE